MYYDKKPGQVYIMFFFFYCLAIIYSSVFVFNGWGMCDKDWKIMNYALLYTMLTKHWDIFMKKTYNKIMKDVKQVVSDAFFSYYNL